jgi:hypothetical protein
MFKIFKHYLVTAPTLMALALVGSGVNVEPVSANDDVEHTLQEIQNYNNQSPMGQVTSVNQLSDVSPTDWAYEALRSLVERYGCIVGYPDRTYRGNRSLSRYEFAAGLNACMQQMERLIANSEAVLREDLEILKRLMKEFETELAMLGARVDNLEGRVAFLEDHQFSTTTKLKGEVILSVQAYDGPDYKLNQFYRLPGTSPLANDPSLFSPKILPGTSLSTSAYNNLVEQLDSGEITQEEFNEAITDSFDDIEEADNQATFSDRVRLTLDTSFTGEDRLRLRLAAGNIPNLGSAFGTDQARLNFEQNTGNDVEIDRAYYITPVGDWGTFFVGTAMPVEEIYQTFSPYTESSGTGALSRALRYNPFIYRTPGNAGIGFKFAANDWFDITASYLADNSSNPSTGGGLFDGTYATGIQLGIYPTENLSFGIAYMHTYFNGDRSGVDVRSRGNLTGSLGSDYSSGVSRAIAILDDSGGFRGARDPFSGAATTSENVGIQGNWRVADWLNISAWGGWSSATAQSHDSTGANRRGDWTELWTWSTNVSFPDLGKDGAVLTVGGGQLPRAGYVEGTFGRDRDQSWIVEGNYKYPVNDNISITPGVYAIFNPNNDSSNDTIVVGVLRTVFRF